MKQDGEYGEFIDTKYSLFGINETRAQDELGYSKEEALLGGYKWQDHIQETKGKETLTQSNVPDSIFDTTESICSEVLACIVCNRNYKILKEELEFYKRMKLPIPYHCFFCRMKKREGYRNQFDLIEKQCSCKSCDFNQEKCKEFFKTFWSDETRSLYCEKCYQNVLD